MATTGPTLSLSLPLQCSENDDDACENDDDACENDDDACENDDDDDDVKRGRRVELPGKCNCAHSLHFYSTENSQKQVVTTTMMAMMRGEEKHDNNTITDGGSTDPSTVGTTPNTRPFKNKKTEKDTKWEDSLVWSVTKCHRLPWNEGGQRPFGESLEIHKFWEVQSSLY